MRDPEVVVGTDRPHIYLSARRTSSEAEKHHELERAADGFAGAGIVYAATHANGQAAHDVLAAAGHRVTLYHAGLGEERHAAMTAFLEGSARIVAATVAFGMGIDKPDVRWVLHVDPPASIDAYYQELGRAGRDEHDAQARLLFRPEDFGKATHLTARSVGSTAVAYVAKRLSTGRDRRARATTADGGRRTPGRPWRRRVDADGAVHSDPASSMSPRRSTRQPRRQRAETRWNAPGST
jgi:ATP-dependent DNA helicase RecQ